MKVEIENNEKIIRADSTKVGDIMIVRKHHEYNGYVLLNTFVGLVSLNNPSETWSNRSAFFVELIPKGTVITLTVE